MSPIRLFWRREAPRGLLLLSLLCGNTLGHADNLLRADNGQDWSDMEAVIAAFLPGSDWQRLEPEALASTLRAQLGFMKGQIDALKACELLTHDTSDYLM